LPNQPPRSASGNSAMRPESGGHSIVNLLLLNAERSNAPSTAQACTSLPRGCLNTPSAVNGPVGGACPVSSSNSRLAAVNASSPSSNRPFGIDHAPSSFFAQNGPPGCTSSTSTTPPWRRYINRPALCCGMRNSPLPCQRRHALDLDQHFRIGQRYDHAGGARRK